MSRAPRQESMSVAQRGFVGQQQLGLEHVEARRERELRAAVARGAARQLRLDRRACAGRTSRANRTSRARAPSARRRRPAVGARLEADRAHRARRQFAQARDDHAVRHAHDRLAGALDLRPAQSVTLTPSTVALPGTYSKPAGSMTIARVLPVVHAARRAPRLRARRGLRRPDPAAATNGIRTARRPSARPSGAARSRCATTCRARSSANCE